MDCRSAKRLYSSDALEVWFRKLCQDWERAFSEGQLREGRACYRDGGIREIELTAEDAIIHGSWRDEESYAVIEWNHNKLHVRGSTEDISRGKCLAAAGLYEIEELIAEEISPLPTERPKTVTTSDDEKPAAESSNGDSPPVPSEGTPILSDTRELQLDFSASELGLDFAVYWLDNNVKVAALGEDALTGDSLSAADREKLIRLANFARKAGFRFSGETNRYLLARLDEVPGFLTNELPRWRKYFACLLTPDALALKNGIRDLDISAQAHEINGEAFELNWRFELDGENISELAAQNRFFRGESLVFLKGRGLVRVNKRQTEALADWRSSLNQQGNGVLPLYLLCSLFGREEVKLDLSEGLDSWRRRLTSPGSDKKDKLLPILRPYQRHGCHWLAHLCANGCHGLLADEMGLGKTLQILSLLVAHPVAGKRSIIVCPASVVPVWQSELRKFFPDQVCRILRKDENFSVSDEPCLWIASYTQLRRHKPQLDQVNFGYAVLDEAQYIKNPEAKVTQACMSIRAEHRIAMTGTPLENRFLDLWTIFRFLMPGLLGSRRRFEEHYQADPEGFMKKVGVQIAPFVLRRTKDKVLKELPGKVESDLVCSMTELQRRLYAQLAEEGVARMGDNLGEYTAENTFSLLTLLTRLRQVSCDPGLLPWMKQTDWQQSGKLLTLVDRLREVVASGHKAVVFSQFVSFLDRVKLMLDIELPGLELHTLTGKTADRAKPVEAFQSTKNPAVMLVSLRAGGTGVTLHSADYVFLLDPWWNPAVENQAIDRVHRIGQRKTVFVYRLVTAGTVEDRVQQLKSSKRFLFEETMRAAPGGADFTQYFHSLHELIDLLPDKGGD
ncbi:DEAD/DEAH box helicase [Ruficoccus amylovorans]|uniref:DEAD/DEAH box helicase n=1 Tax=Ruficoccus amylovorans TaxID=1804625 RepID=A0A842HFG0_9BACT|nr:DEAD/DEAH box helicase [Ruficoccus amylovorans]MBC2594778.1 DEAD/DEAH box helicase [Ruficoccus amylovorans]